MDSLSDRIEEISQNIALSSYKSAADVGSKISSTIGTETPVTILADTRNVQGKILDAIVSLKNAVENSEANAERRHREMCTIMLGLVQSSKERELQQVRHQSSGIASRSMGKDTYYYGSMIISTGTHVVACILMHLDIMTASHVKFKKLQASDTTFMDLKDWYNITSYALNADKSSKVGLRIPKPTDEDFKCACKLTASLTPGRRPICDTSHLQLMLSECPGILNTVEWTRRALVRCKGVLSPERECRISHVSHPFVTAEDTLNVPEVKKLILTRREYHLDIADLKATQKKEYMNLILSANYEYADALDVVTSKKK